MNDSRRPIKDSFIERIKDNADIAAIVGNTVQLKSSSSGRYMGLCPFHDEKTPSFSVSSANNVFHCFGCGAKGDILTFLMQTESLDFYEAVHRLAELQNVAVEYETSSKNAGKTKVADADYQVVKLAAEFYAQQLSIPENAQGLEYLKQRNCSQDLIQEYGLGYAPARNDDLWQLMQSDVLKEAGLRTGLVKKNDEGGYYDVFRARVMFPIMDARRRVLGFGGRIINGSSKAKYINSTDSDIFHKEQHLFGLPQALNAKIKKDSILVVEGYMDVMAMAGLEKTVACLGTAFSTFHAKNLLQRANTLILAFDGDEAGAKAAIRAMRQCFPFLGDNKELLLQFMPQGKDPYDFVNEAEDKQTAWNALKPTPVEDFLLHPFHQRMDMQSSRLAINNLVGFLVDFPPSSTRRELIRRKAGELLGGIEINLPTKSPPSPSKRQTFTKPAVNPPIIGESKGFPLLQKLVFQLLLKPNKASNLLEKWEDRLNEAGGMVKGESALSVLHIIQAAQQGPTYLYGHIAAMNISLPNLHVGHEQLPNAWYGAGECVKRILENVYNQELRVAIQQEDKGTQNSIRERIRLLRAE